MSGRGKTLSLLRAEQPVPPPLLGDGALLLVEIDGKTCAYTIAELREFLLSERR
jgi:hypothetical protein